jgi:hypothetical protein
MMTAEAEENPAATVRRTLRSGARATLGTPLRAAAGAPYVSLVNIATDHPLAGSRLPWAFDERHATVLELRPPGSGS